MSHLLFANSIAVSYKTKQGAGVGLMNNDEIVYRIDDNKLTI